jgi:hypothetical protein
MTLTARELALISTTNVLGYVQAKNAERNAQAVAEGWQFWTTMPEDPEFLSEFENAYELELMYAIGTYSDVFKDEYCYRPDLDMSGMTLAEVEDRIESI